MLGVQPVLVQPNKYVCIVHMGILGFSIFILGGHALYAVNQTAVCL